MPIDHVEEIRDLLYDREAIVAGGERLAEYIYRLIKVLAVDQLREIQVRLNALLDTNSIDYIYFNQRNSITGMYPSGTWREGVSDTGAFVRQKYVDGEWVTVTEDDV